MTVPEFDAVIAGGGLSGLSLAAALATGGWRDRSVLLIDDNAESATARWGYWSARPGLLDAAACRTYGQVEMHAGGVARVLPLGHYRYHLVRRTDLRRVAAAIVAGCPHFRLRTGRVESIRDGTDHAEAVVDGDVVRGTWVFTSITPGPGSTSRDSPNPGSRGTTRLAFTGWEVVCGTPAFDPDTPVLFDYRVPQAGCSRFAYVLPEDKHRALVELTAFVSRGVRPPPAEECRASLVEYLTTVFGVDDYRIVGTEGAVLPLRARPRRRAIGHVMSIGAPAGLIKASTGYAYQRIQRDSAAIASSLQRHGHPFAVPSSRRRHRFLDAVLLDVLDRDPAELERAFCRLFLANPAERVLRFLDEDSTIRDEARLVATMPWPPYLRAAAARVFGRAASRS